MSCTGAVSIWSDSGSRCGSSSGDGGSLDPRMIEASSATDSWKSHGSKSPTSGICWDSVRRSWSIEKSSARHWWYRSKITEVSRKGLSPDCCSDSPSGDTRSVEVWLLELRRLEKIITRHKGNSSFNGSYSWESSNDLTRICCWQYWLISSIVMGSSTQNTWFEISNSCLSSLQGINWIH